MLQGMWVFMCTYPALIALASPTANETTFLWIGALVWLLGWGYEVVADTQKTTFNKDPKNEGKFVNLGVWKQSRHLNYVGELVLWTGITIIAAPVYQGTQWFALITPIFVYWLLNKVSGVNLLKQGPIKSGAMILPINNIKRNPHIFPKTFLNLITHDRTRITRTR